MLAELAMLFALWLTSANSTYAFIHIRFRFCAGAHLFQSDDRCAGPLGLVRGPYWYCTCVGIQQYSWYYYTGTTGIVHEKYVEFRTL